MLKTPHFSGDRPVENSEQDRLGFTASANHVAEAILKFASPEGFVLGLEGAWGSGKSSYVNLIINALHSAEASPEVVKFSPWLISSRDGLLGELFREVGQAALKIDLVEEEAPKKRGLSGLLQNAGRVRRHADREAKRKKLSKALGAFASSLARAGKLAEMAELLGVPYAGLAGRGMQAAGGAANALTATPSLESEKERLKGELRKLTRKIVVFVDDLDRLEPAEAGEVVRLVRAVADFPNIVYVLCYSRAVLAQSLSNALAIENGETYIEKIVQVTFSVPKPEDFDLRRMFREELEAVFPQAINVAENAESRMRHQRLARVIDAEGARSLTTPRDVVRSINALRLYVGPIIDKVDLADMVWLQLIRVRDAALYDWIETYINNFAAVSAGARVSEADAAGMMTQLADMLEKSGRNVDDGIQALSDVLPGIERRARPNNAAGIFWGLFINLGDNALANYTADRRLGSPQHFRLYFALSKPEGALDDAEFEAFIAQARDNPEQAAESFVRLAGTRRPQGGVRAEAILSRLAGEGMNKVPVDALPGLILSLASGMDVAASTTGMGDWGKYWTWNSADRVFAAALKRLPSNSRREVILNTFGSGAALGWLVSLFRDEIFAHGRYGEREKPETERTLTPEEFELVVEKMIERFKRTNPASLLRTPQFLSLLYAWSQATDTGALEATTWVAERIATDTDMLNFLEHVRSWTAINDRVVYPLRADNLRPFLDYDATRTRVAALAQGADPIMSETAARLLAAFQQGEDD